MRLSVYMITKDSAAYVERVLRVARVIADELVIAVDSASVDDTLRICQGYADKLITLDPLGASSRARPWMTSQCSGDWILYLDDDELPSSKLVEALPRLLADREVTHHWIQVRWLMGREPMRWLTAWPWRCHWSLRLMRNLPSLIYAPGLLHSGVRVAGDGSYVTEGAIYHLDAVYHDEAWRRQKVRGYRRIGEGDPLAELYLPEDHPQPTAVPIPDDDGLWDPPLERLNPGTGRGGAVRHVTADELARAARLEVDLDPSAFRGSLTEVEVPSPVPPSKLFFAEIDLRNESDITWHPPGPRRPSVRVSYHWLRPGGEIYAFDGRRTELPRTLHPGAATRMIAVVETPAEPGRFLLQWDLLIEGVTWFSTQGWQGPEPRPVTIGFDGADAAKRTDGADAPSPGESVPQATSTGSRGAAPAEG